MSSKGKEEGEGKKKGGKLPIIIVLVLVLAGGGFFMMKGKGDSKAKPKVELGAEIVELGEILCNLKGDSNFARVNIGLQFAKGFSGGGHGPDAMKPVIRDAIIMVISSKTIGEIRSAEGKEALKVEIAAAINHSLHKLHPEEKPKDEKKGDEKDKDKEGEKDQGEEDSHGAKGEREHLDWHSDEGPVLIVYFSDFVTQ